MNNVNIWSGAILVGLLSTSLWIQTTWARENISTSLTNHLHRKIHQLHTTRQWCMILMLERGLTWDSQSFLSWSSNSLFLCLSFSTESLCVCSILSLSSAMSLSFSRVLLVRLSLMFSFNSFFSLALSRVLSSDRPYKQTECIVPNVYWLIVKVVTGVWIA